MSFEYLIKCRNTTPEDIADCLSKNMPEEPFYFGKVTYPDGDAFEFRTSSSNPKSPPDATVMQKSCEVYVCTESLAKFSAPVLGAVVKSLIEDLPDLVLEISQC